MRAKKENTDDISLKAKGINKDKPMWFDRNAAINLMKNPKSNGGWEFVDPKDAKILKENGDSEPSGNQGNSGGTAG